jgi:hypothetical protein
MPLPSDHAAEKDIDKQGDVQEHSGHKEAQQHDEQKDGEKPKQNIDNQSHMQEHSGHKDIEKDGEQKDGEQPGHMNIEKQGGEVHKHDEQKDGEQHEQKVDSTDNGG